MTNIDSAILDRVPYAVTDPERIPVQRYYDEEFYRFECERLWPHVWQMACRLEQIPEVGDWIEYTNVGYSVIVVRTRDGVKAFHNACRHRGVPFAGGTTVGSSHSTAHGNCAAKGFICPFHGWRWNMDGENTFVYGRHLFSDKQLDPDDINLVPCRVETALGCAFINLDDDAPGLIETFGSITKSLDAHNIEHLRAEWCYATVLPANWKTAMEAFMEGIHVRQTHPQLYDALPELIEGIYEAEDASGPTTRTSIDRGDATTRQAIDAQVGFMEVLNIGMAGQLHAKELAIAKELADAELPDNPAEGMPQWFGMVMSEITNRLQARGERVPDLISVSQSDPLKGVEFLFPHWFLLPYFASFASYRVRPLGPESCLFEIWSLTTLPEGEEPEPVMEPTVLPFNSAEYPPIPRQDYSNIPIQQKGLHSKGFEFMRLSKDIEGLVSNYERVIDGYLAGLDPKKLAKATNELGGNFDGAIKALGF